MSQWSGETGSDTITRNVSRGGKPETASVEFFLKKSKKGRKIRGIKKGFGLPCGPVVENLPAKAGDTGPIPGPGRSHTPWSN